ncbi:P-loop NTPase fold protein [Riemerella anatipestifer]|nr:P-loop NTPase fold protein [Riemerella anatipestifer]MDY3326143.1 P-loop NTPase fold protein [Riemerella anatipestifer]MDY3354493.1 P-loop NTPase fold protein [Riemerella anatipestifer]
MTTEHIEQIFTDYIKTDKTQYAILLNGSWGCGKTYFWKYTLDKLAKDSKFNTIYLSLNGISKIEDLDHQLFIKLIPFISNQENNIIKNATKFLGNALNKLSSHYLNTSLSDIFKGVSIDTFNFSKYIVCFDDLERCQIPVKEVLGFINNLVEHKNLKTIILAHEPEIDKANGYERIKEKVVGRDLKFELDIASTLPNLFEKYNTNTDFHNFLKAQINVITEILIEYKQDNLRIITFYLDTLERVFPALKNVETAYIQEIILFSAIITIEYKSGGLSSADYNNFKGIDIIDEHYYSLYIARTMRKSEKEEKERDKPYAETFYEKYLDKKVKEYFFYPSIYSYILSGYFDQKKLENEIKKRYPEVISKEIQDFRTLLHYKFRELSDEDFARLTKDVLQYAKEGKYSIYDYVQIANFFYFFSKNNLITESKEDIDKILNDGLDIAKSRKQINDRVVENLLHFGDENPDVTVIKKLIKEIHNEIKKEEYVANSNELIDCLTNKDEFALAEIFEKHKFSKELFQYTDDKLLLDTILKISNKQLFNFTELLQHRYEISNIGEFLFEDTDCLNKLKTSLSDYLDKNENIGQPRKFLLATLETTLILTIQHLNDTRKK